MKNETPVPNCPECGEGNVDALNSDDRYYRYQCKNSRCLHGWTQPRTTEERERVVEKKVYGKTEAEVIAMVSRGTEICAKGCGRNDLKFGPGKSAHERHCDGKPREGKPAKAAGKRKPAKNGALETATESMIVALRAKRDQIINGIPELQKVDQAIAALEALSGGGGGVKARFPARTTMAA